MLYSELAQVEVFGGFITCLIGIFAKVIMKMPVMSLRHGQMNGKIAARLFGITHSHSI